MQAAAQGGILEVSNDSAFTLVNINEELVKREAKSIMQTVDMCRCDKCYFDVCALVLNQMPPQYTTTQKGALLASIQHIKRPQEIDLMLLIAMACKMVKESPRHQTD